MTYVKPEIVVLGAAGVLIEAFSKTQNDVDGSPDHANPAYDLDE